MKLCTCFLLFRIFAYTISTPLNTPRELKNGPYQYVFKATEEPVTAHHKIPQAEFRAPRIETVTDFIQEVANILNTYEDIAFTDFFDILDKEIRKYHYKGCKFYELTENYEFRSQLAEKLDLIKRKSVPVLKAEINEVATVIRHGTYGKNVKELLEYINSLYREDAREKFLKVLSDLNAYGNSTSERPKNYLVKIIRDGVRAIVFDHYTDLNINVRRALNKEIASFLNKIKAAPSSNSTTNLFPYTPVVRESKNTVKINEYNVAIEDGNPEHKLKIDTASTADNKDLFLFKASGVKHQDEATKVETSKEKDNIQQLQITYLGTDKSSDESIEGSSIELFPELPLEFNSRSNATLYTEDISFMTTEKPEIMFKSDLKSKLVQRMLVEEAIGRLETVQPTILPRLRLMSNEGHRRSIAPPLPGEELSIEVFDRDRGKKEKVLVKRNRIANRHGTTSNEERQAEPDKLRKKIPSRITSRNVSGKDLKRSIASTLPEEELFIDVLDREERKTQKSLSKSNNIATMEHWMKDYFKRIRNVQNEVNQLKKNYENFQKNRVNVISNGYEKKYNNEEREPKRHFKKIKTVNEEGHDLDSNKEEIAVNNYDRHIHNLNNKKKATRSETTKATKSTKKVRSVNIIPVFRFFERLPTAKNKAVSTTVNVINKRPTKTSSLTTKKAGNAALKVTEEVKQKRIHNNATYDYAKKDDTTRRYRRFLQFSSPPLYDQPFADHRIRGLHPVRRIN